MGTLPATDNSPAFSELLHDNYLVKQEDVVKACAELRTKKQQELGPDLEVAMFFLESINDEEGGTYYMILEDVGQSPRGRLLFGTLVINNINGGGHVRHTRGLVAQVRQCQYDGFYRLDFYPGEHLRRLIVE